MLLKRTAQANLPKGTRSIAVVIAVIADGNGATPRLRRQHLAHARQGHRRARPAKPTLVVACKAGTLSATVRPAKGAAVTSVTFLVNGQAVGVDKKAPFSARVGTAGPARPDQGSPHA